MRKHLFLISFAAILFGFLSAAHAGPGDNCNSDNTDPYTCLVCNCFYETIGEPAAGKLAVAKVVMTRTRMSRYPDSVCGVIYDPSQFSWTNRRPMRGRVKIIPGVDTDNHRIGECYKAARESLQFTGMSSDSFYNPKTAKPHWAGSCRSNGKIGNHAFMSCRSRPAARRAHGKRGNR